jgi:hypothetical protein
MASEASATPTRASPRPILLPVLTAEIATKSVEGRSNTRSVCGILLLVLGWGSDDSWRVQPRFLDQARARFHSIGATTRKHVRCRRLAGCRTLALLWQRPLKPATTRRRSNHGEDPLMLSRRHCRGS